MALQAVERARYHETGSAMKAILYGGQEAPPPRGLVPASPARRSDLSPSLGLSAPGHCPTLGLSTPETVDQLMQRVLADRPQQPAAEFTFDAIDTNRDGVLDREEFRAAYNAFMNRPAADPPPAAAGGASGLAHLARPLQSGQTPHACTLPWGGAVGQGHRAAGAGPAECVLCGIRFASDPDLGRRLAETERLLAESNAKVAGLERRLNEAEQGKASLASLVRRSVARQSAYDERQQLAIEAPTVSVEILSPGLVGQLRERLGARSGGDYAGQPTAEAVASLINNSQKLRERLGGARSDDPSGHHKDGRAAEAATMSVESLSQGLVEELRERLGGASGDDQDGVDEF